MDAPFDILGLAMDAIGAALPQYVAPVALTATREDGTHRGTLAACTIDEGFEEVFDDVGTSTKIRKLTLFVRKCDWYGCVRSDPQAGDQFKSPNTGRVYALKDVTSATMSGWKITAREVAET